jgi:leader peptidase (prepilin peptidase) / N-methyltransferase
MEIISTFQNNFAFLLTTVTILGLVVGSFLNVVIYRLPKMLENNWKAECAELFDYPQISVSSEKFNLSHPNSHCPHCKNPIRYFENIPIFSYLLQGGKCNHCKTPISMRYPLVELASGLLAALVVFKFGFSWALAGGLIFVWVLLVLSLIDIDTQLLPDNLTLPLLWLGLLLNLYGVYTDLNSAVIGAMIGYLSLWSIYWLFKLLTGKEGMGYGDFKLFAAFGAWFGWKMLLPILLLSSLVGAVIGIAMMLILGHDKNIPIPFGPYLAGAGLIALFFGQPILKAMAL